MNSIARTSALLDSSRDLTVESAGSARMVNVRPSLRDLSFAQVKKLLDSRNDREILDGLKRVIAMIYRSKPCLPYFSAVVKNVASPNVEIKKLVYIYLLHYAESEPDLALLSINTIQKSLSDPSPQIRALALRVMSGIRVPVISQIVSLAIKKGVADMNPLVRKAAALAIPKCYRLDPSTLPQLLEFMSTLLGDRQYFVVGPAVMAFNQVCPDEIDLIHKHYRSLIRKMVDMDEWSQLATLKLLTSYSRRCFPRKTRRKVAGKDTGFYDDAPIGDEKDGLGDEIQVIDPDLELFLKACKNLLSSRNSAIIVTVVRCLLALGTPKDLDVAVGPLVALLRTSKDIQAVAMYNIIAVCLVRPQLFTEYATHFLIKSLESITISKLKFEVLTLIFPFLQSDIQDVILVEFEHLAHSNDPELVQESIRAIGRCANYDGPSSAKCLSLLLESVSGQDGRLVASSLTVIRHLIQRDPQLHLDMVIRLAKNLDSLTDPEARASVVWLVGEYASLPGRQNIAPDVLRILAGGFAGEADATKLQIVLLAAKVYLHYLLQNQPARAKKDETSDVDNQEEDQVRESTARTFDDERAEGSTETDHGIYPTHQIPKLWNYILQLTRYDTSYDLRDRARMYKALLSDPTSTEIASLMLLAPKPVPHAPSPSEYRRGILLGSTGLVLGTKSVLGYEDLPDWVKEGDEPDAKLREEPIAGGAGGGGARSGYPSPRAVPAAAELDRAVTEKGLEKVEVPTKGKTLDDWLNEESGSEGEEAEEEDGSMEEETETEGEDGESEGEYEEVTDSGSEDEEEKMREPLVH